MGKHKKHKTIVVWYPLHRWENWNKPETRMNMAVSYLSVKSLKKSTPPIFLFSF